MKAWQLTDTEGPDSYQLNEVEEPEPGPGQVRIKIKYLGPQPPRSLAVTGLAGAEAPASHRWCRRSRGRRCSR